MKNMGINISDYIPANKISVKKDNDLKEACREFESIFNFQMLKSMRSTVDKCDLFHGGQGEDLYESLLDQEYAKIMAGSGSNSLTSALYRQLSNKDSEETHGDENILPISPHDTQVSSNFGKRKDPITGEERFHKGIDLAAKEGTPIHSILPGKVIESRFEEGYGNVVVIDHGNELNTVYAHNRKNLVMTGDVVEKGAIIANVGSTGRSTGPHLHFEVRKNTQNLDPSDFLDLDRA